MARQGRSPRARRNLRPAGTTAVGGGGGASPYFAFRAVYDIGDKTDVNQPPNCTNDYASPTTSLGITHVITPIATASVATALNGKGLKSGGWFTGNQRNTTASGASAANSGTITVASTSGFPSSGKIYHSSGAITYSGTSGGNTFTGCGSHASISNGDDIVGFANNMTTVTNLVNAVKGTTAGSDHYYYLADEPDYSAAMAVALNDKCTTIRAADASAVCVMADYTVISGRSQLTNWANNTTVDEVFLSGAFSPIRSSAGSPGTYQSTYIPDQITKAAAAHTARPGLRFKGVIDMHNDVYSVVAPDTAYTGVNAVIPSFPGATMAATSATNQIKAQVDDYRAGGSTITGIIAFSYGPYPEQSGGNPPSGWTGWLRGGWGAADFHPRTDLIAEMAAQFLRT